MQITLNGIEITAADAGAPLEPIAAGDQFCVKYKGRWILLSCKKVFHNERLIVPNENFPLFDEIDCFKALVVIDPFKSLKAMR